ncbi:MAG: MFS transporter [Caldilineaceae bacterium]
MTIHSVSVPSIRQSTRNRLLITLFVAASIFNAAQIASFTMLPITATELTGGESQAGLPATIVLLGRALIAYPIGWLMDKLGRRLGIAMGFAMSVLGMVVCVLAIGQGSFVGFCLGALMNGMGRGTGEQSRYAAADVSLPERSASAVGWIVFAGTIGSVAGPWLLPFAEKWAELWNLPSLAGPFAVTGVLSAVSSLIIFFLLFPDPKHISQRMQAERPVLNSHVRSQREIFADPTVRLAVVALTISQLVMTLIMVVNPLHMKHLHYELTDIAFVTMAHTLGMFLFAGATGWMVSKFGRLPMIVLGGLVLSASAILAPLARGVPMLAVALFLLGLGWSFGYVAASSLLSSALSPGERGRTQGISETLVAFAAAMGSYSTGPAFGWGGIVAVSMIGLIFSLFLIGSTLLVQSRTPVLVSGD